MLPQQAAHCVRATWNLVGVQTCAARLRHELIMSCDKFTNYKTWISEGHLEPLKDLRGGIPRQIREAPMARDADAFR
eukprot:7872021-Alexandrium_andersonii.AAC.1